MQTLLNQFEIFIILRPFACLAYIFTGLVQLSMLVQHVHVCAAEHLFVQPSMSVQHVHLCAAEDVGAAEHIGAACACIPHRKQCMNYRCRVRLVGNSFTASVTGAGGGR